MLTLFFRRRMRRRQLRRMLAGLGPGGPRRLVVWASALCALHVAAMMALEGMTAGDAVWLTATTIVTVGYGDLSAATPMGRAATILLMYVGGIFVLAKAASDWFDARAEAAGRRLHGYWDWDMDDHLLIIGNPFGADDAAAERSAAFYDRLIAQIHAHPAWADVPVEVLCTVFEGRGLPPALRDAGVAFRAGRASDGAALESCHPERARSVIVLASAENDAAADAIAFDAVDRLRRAGFKGRLVVECVEDANRARLGGAGASGLVRPMRGYPEMLARAVVAPGSEQIITDLFTAEGDECHRIDLPKPWSGVWADLCRRLIGAGVGTPLGYVDGQGRVDANPRGPREVEAHALFVVVNEADEAGLDRIPGLLEG